MKIKALGMVLSLVLVIILAGCTTTITNINPTDSSTTTPPYTPPYVTALSPDYILYSGHSVVIPDVGLNVDANKTVTLAWSANGSVTAYILTVTQYSNFKANGANIPSSWMAIGNGTDGSINTYVQNADTYYAVISNGLGFTPTVKLYSDTLTIQ